MQLTKIPLLFALTLGLSGCLSACSEVVLKTTPSSAPVASSADVALLSELNGSQITLVQGKPNGLLTPELVQKAHILTPDLIKVNEQGAFEGLAPGLARLQLTHLGKTYTWTVLVMEPADESPGVSPEGSPPPSVDLPQDTFPAPEQVSASTSAPPALPSQPPLAIENTLDPLKNPFASKEAALHPALRSAPRIQHILATPTTLVLHWQDQQPAQTLAYQIYLNGKLIKELPKSAGADYRYEFQNLTPGETYQVSLSATNQSIGQMGFHTQEVVTSSATLIQPGDQGSATLGSRVLVKLNLSHFSGVDVQKVEVLGQDQVLKNPQGQDLVFDFSTSPFAVVNANLSQVWDTTGLGVGQKTLQVRVKDKTGNTVYTSPPQSFELRNSGSSGGGQPGTPDPVFKNISFAVGSANLQPFDDTVLATLNAPNMTPIQINLGQASPQSITFPNVPEGTWTLTLKRQNQPAAVGTATVTVSQNGNLTYSVGGALNNPLVLPPVLTSVTAQTHPNLPSLVSRWSAENNALDTQNAHPGTLQNGVGFGVGKQGFAFALDGTDDHIRIPQAPALTPGSGDFSLVSWVKSLPKASTQTILRQFENGQTLGGQSLYGMALDNTGRLLANLRQSDGTTQDEQAATPVLTDGQYHHVSVVRDTALGQVKMYIDGALARQAPLGVTGPIQNDDGENDPLAIGSQIGGGGALSSLFEGWLDEVMYYNQALSLGQVQILKDQRLLRVQGLGFSSVPANHTVTVGGQPATVASSTATELNLVVPNGLSGNQDVRVTLNTAQSNALTQSIPPTLSAVDRLMENPGATLVLSGQGFEPSASVQINGQNAAVTFNSETQLTLTVPAGVTRGPIVLTQGAFQVTGPVFTPLPQSASLKGWWKGENNANDSTAGNHHGTYLGDATFAAGQVGQSFNLDGVGDVIEVPAHADLEPTQYTYALWFKRSGPSPNTTHVLLMKGENNNGGNNGYHLRFHDGGSQFDSFHFNSLTSGDHGGIHFGLNGAVFAQPQWHHLAVTYNGALLKTYLDGQEVASGANPNPPVYVGGQSFVIGAQRIPGGPPNFTNFTNGQIDEVMLYNQALSAGDIQNIYQATR